MLEPTGGEQLHAHADAEERSPFNMDAFGDRLDHAGDRRKTATAVGERPDAGQDDVIRRGNGVGVGGELDRRARPALARCPFERLHRGMQVTRPIVDDRDVQASTLPVDASSEPLSNA